MKSLKIAIIFLVFIGIATIFLWTDEKIEKDNANEAIRVIATEPTIEVSESIETNLVKSQVSQLQSNPLNQEKSRITWNKKVFEDDWCLARAQLSKADQMLAQTEQQDWEVLLGKATVIQHDSPQYAESWYSNNEYMQAYESMPPEELQVLAEEGDKWAMVAFVQHERAKAAVKDKIAKKLLVQGTSYYAVDRLVTSSLVDAQVYAEKRNMEATTDSVIEAMAYMYWGLEHYNDGGLSSFIAITASEPFASQFPVASVLKDSQQAIEQRLQEIKQSVAKQRAALDIEMPEPTAAVKKLFRQSIAIKEISSKEQLDLYRSLDISANKTIAMNSCIEKIYGFHKQESN